MARSRLTGLTGLDLETAPSVCHACVWWQSRGRVRGRQGALDDPVEEEFGAFGTVYYGDEGRRSG